MATSEEFPFLYSQYKELEKFFEGRSSSPLQEAANRVRQMPAAKVEAAALDIQQWDASNPSIVTCVLRVVAEVLDHADGS